MYLLILCRPGWELVRGLAGGPGPPGASPAFDGIARSLEDDPLLLTRLSGRFSLGRGCERRMLPPCGGAMRLARLPIRLGTLLLVLGVCRASGAANICDETVPSNRFIDGFPAYSQCTASSSSSIYSNNGVDTATASGGTGWVRTQGSGGYQCTEWAHRYLYFKWNVQSVPNGNAGTWCDGTIPTGLVKTTTPVHGDLIVFAPGSCGADATASARRVRRPRASGNRARWPRCSPRRRRRRAVPGARSPPW